MPAGASTTCCRISAAPSTRSAARTKLHGVGGPLAVSNVCEPHPLCEAFIDAAQQAGYPRNDDFNGPEQEGAGYFQLTAKNGRRWSTAVGYLRPARRRPNLVVETNALATPRAVRGPARDRRRISAGRQRRSGPRRPRGHPRRRRVQLAATDAVVRARPGRAAARRTASAWSPTCRASARICRIIFRSASSIAAPSRSP